MNKLHPALLGVAAVALLSLGLVGGCLVGKGCNGPDKPVVDPQPPVVVLKPTQATYVYEKDDTAVPTGVKTALNRLNRERNILATDIDDDIVDGTGETSEQYKVALAAAKEVGLPALVVQSDATVLKVVKNPQTEQDVMEAAQ